MPGGDGEDTRGDGAAMTTDPRAKHFSAAQAIHGRITTLLNAELDTMITENRVDRRQIVSALCMSLHAEFVSKASQEVGLMTVPEVELCNEACLLLIGFFSRTFEEGI